MAYLYPIVSLFLTLINPVITYVNTAAYILVRTYLISYTLTTNSIASTTITHEIKSILHEIKNVIPKIPYLTPFVNSLTTIDFVVIGSIILVIIIVISCTSRKNPKKSVFKKYNQG